MPLKTITKQTNNLAFSSAAFFIAIRYSFKNTWVWKYVAIAILLNVLIYISFAIILFFFANNITEFGYSFVPQNWFTGGLETILQIILWLLFLFLISFTFNFVAPIVNSPVYSALTAKIIEKELPDVILPEHNIITEVWIALIFELKKLALVLVILLLTLILNLIPFIGTVVFLIINLVQITFIAGIDFFEPYHSLKGYKFRQRLFEVFKKFSLYSPFSLISGFLASLPFVHIITSPVSIIGAAIIAKKRLVKH